MFRRPLLSRSNFPKARLISFSLSLYLSCNLHQIVFLSEKCCERQQIRTLLFNEKIFNFIKIEARNRATTHCTSKHDVRNKFYVQAVAERIKVQVDIEATIFTTFSCSCIFRPSLFESFLHRRPYHTVLFLNFHSK